MEAHIVSFVIEMGLPLVLCLLIMFGVGRLRGLTMENFPERVSPLIRWWVGSEKDGDWHERFPEAC